MSTLPEPTLDTADDLKTLVQDKYGAIAKREQDSCCATSCCGGDDATSIMTEDYTNVEGYVPEADLGLGCGLPLEHAGISAGDTVVDLGAGAGNDAFIARSIVGDKGRVIGVDFTPEMVEKAEANRAKLGYENVAFVRGDIEAMPLEDNLADVVISNCVLNLVPDKAQAFSEVYRILKPGAHFSISDIVIRGQLPEELQRSAELYVGCVSGALPEGDYLAAVKQAGFDHVAIKKSRAITLPDDLLAQYLTDDQRALLAEETFGIFSITVVGTK